MCLHAFMYVMGIYLHHVPAKRPLKPEGIGAPGTGVPGVVNHLMWVLGTKPRFSVGAMCVLKC